MPPRVIIIAYYYYYYFLLSSWSSVYLDVYANFVLFARDAKSNMTCSSLLRISCSPGSGKRIPLGMGLGAVMEVSLEY